MSRYIYRLVFDTPVHFGTADQGSRLEQTGYTCSADLLFGAICCELAMHAETDALKDFVDKIQHGSILFSDLLPYQQSDELMFFLPKPVLLTEASDSGVVHNLQETRNESTLRKKQKKLEYLRAAHITPYLTAHYKGESFSASNDFGMISLAEKVNCRETDPLPYYVGSFGFYETTGLYLLAVFQETADAELFEALLTSLGISGIGGKRSSGYGKFHLAAPGERLEDVAGSDARAMQCMLGAEHAGWQMLISSLIPSETDIEILKSSQYKLRQCGGFVTPMPGEIATKKNSIYTIAAGSCLIKRIEGNIISLGKSNGHDILRAGKGLYMGLCYEK